MGRKDNLIEKNAESANQNNPSLRNFAKQNRGNPNDSSLRENFVKQNFRGKPPYEKNTESQGGWLLRNARKSFGLPRRFCESARNDNFLDSSVVSLPQNDNLGEIAESALEIFYQICNIPHPSGQTKDLQKFIVDFLRACECEVKSDSAGNIYALKGTPKLVFQAHYDMVLVGDEVVPFIENGFLKSRNSSLGADNGAAVALLLCLAKRVKNIEILLTNDEEIGMLGAKNLALQTHNKKMINLDSECVEEMCVGCAGGFDVDIDLGKANSSCGDFSQLRKARFLDEPFVLSASLASHNCENSSTILEFASCKNAESTLDSANQNISSLRDSAKQNRGNPKDLRALRSNQPPYKNIAESQGGLPRRFCESARNDEFFYEFSAQNFKGGHSGIDIDKNIKNAIVELLFALDSARQMGEFEILELSGGEARNSIPINARAVIATNAPINPTQNAESMPHIAIKKLSHYTPKQKPLKSAVVAHLLRLHNGIYEMEQGSVTSSLNFSIISNEVLKIMVRGNKAECLDRQILRLKYLFGEAVEISGFYNAWEANLASCGRLNSSLGASCGDLADFGHCADSSLALHPKSAKNSTTSTAIRRICEQSEAINTRICDLENADSATRAKITDSALDSADSQNLGENQAKIAESTLLSTLSCIYTKHKIPFKIIQIHAGLECGILKDKCALDEVISIGPTILHPHSKGEMMDLASFGRFCTIVEDLCEA